MKFTVTHPALKFSPETDPVFQRFDLKEFSLPLYVPRAQVSTRGKGDMALEEMVAAAPKVTYPYQIGYATVEYSPKLRGLYAEYLFVEPSQELLDAIKPDAPDPLDQSEDPI